MDKSLRRSHRCVQACSILGQACIYLPNGIRWVWGNLTVYTGSYFYFRGGVTVHNVNTPWLLSIFMVAWAVGVFVSGPLVKYLGKGGTQIFGCVVYNVGLLLSYVSVRCNSITGLNFTFGAIIGFGDGIAETIIILVVSDWAGDHQGLFLSLAFSSAILGSVVLNQLATWYINPLNLKPELPIGQSLFFTQPSVLEKTPSFFLILLVVSVIVHTIGVVMTRYNRTSESKSKCRVWRSCLCYQNDVDKFSKHEDMGPLTQSNAESPAYPRSSEEHNGTHSVCHTEESCIIDKDSTTNVDKDTPVVDLTPRQALLTPAFHSLWFGYTCSEFSKVWLLNYYKIFGLRYIPNDHFLTNLGAVMAILASLSRSVWGWSTDRVGLKPSLIACTALLTVITCFYYFTALVDRWLYAAATLVYGATNSGYSILTTILTVTFFGRTHFPVNYGMVCLPSIVANALAPLLYEGFLERWGWFPLLATIGAVNAFSLAIQCCLMPAKPR